MATKESRYTMSFIKTSLNVTIAIAIAVALLLVNFFVIDGIGGQNEVHDVAYWLNKILTAVGTFLIMIAIANVTEDARKRKDKSFGDRLKAIDEHYLYINENSLTEEIEFYILQKNINAKYNAHIKKWKRKLAKAKKDDDKLRCELKLVMTPDEVWACPDRIKFVKITYSQLISGASEVSANEEENDLSVHKGRLVLKKMLMKAISIIGAGLYLPEIATHFSEFSTADVLPLVIRFILILWACYSGVCFGYAVVDRVLIVLKRKIKVFSEFDARTQNKSVAPENRYKIALQKDAQLEKLRAKHNVTDCGAFYGALADKSTEVSTDTPNGVKEAINEFRTNPKPIMPTQAIKTLAQSHIAEKTA